MPLLGLTTELTKAQTSRWQHQSDRFTPVKLFFSKAHDKKGINEKKKILNIVSNLNDGFYKIDAARDIVTDLQFQ